MGVILKKGRNGKFRRHWYGKYEIDGRTRVINLAVPVKGTPPASLRGKSDDKAFERSRARAETALEKYAEDAHQKGRAEHLTERLIEMKTGRPVEYARLSDLCTRWQALARAVSPSKRHSEACDAKLKRFVAFMARTRPNANHLFEVTVEDVAAYAENLKTTFAPKTADDAIKLLRRSFGRLLPVGMVNPFAGFVGNFGNDNNGTVHRKPFTPEELRALLDVSKDDPLMHPLIVTAACTGMRRGDICRLKWRDVDFDAGMIQVKTSKTGAEVEIPIFPPLRAVLEARKGNGSEFVFPSAAAMLADNPDGLTHRFKAYVARILTDTSKKVAPTPPPTDSKQIESEGLAAIKRLPEGPRREHIHDTFTRYMAGASVREIAVATDTSRGSVSGWLAVVSGMIDKPVVRTATAGIGVKAAIAHHTRIAREQGQRAASIRDWHTLRATWVTLALTAGVPMELVRRVTGHATVDVVLKHYFRPGREEFKAVLANALPDVLTGGKSAPLSPAAELAALAGKLAAGVATAEDRARLRKLAARV